MMQCGHIYVIAPFVQNELDPLVWREVYWLLLIGFGDKIYFGWGFFEGKTLSQKGKVGGNIRRVCEYW